MSVVNWNALFGQQTPKSQEKVAKSQVNSLGSQLKEFVSGGLLSLLQFIRNKPSSPVIVDNNNFVSNSENKANTADVQEASTVLQHKKEGLLRRQVKRVSFVNFKDELNDLEKMKIPQLPSVESIAPIEMVEEYEARGDSDSMDLLRYIPGDIQFEEFEQQSARNGRKMLKRDYSRLELSTSFAEEQKNEFTPAQLKQIKRIAFSGFQMALRCAREAWKHTNEGKSRSRSRNQRNRQKYFKFAERQFNTRSQRKSEKDQQNLSQLKKRCLAAREQRRPLRKKMVWDQDAKERYDVSKIRQLLDEGKFQREEQRRREKQLKLEEEIRRKAYEQQLILQRLRKEAQLREEIKVRAQALAREQALRQSLLRKAEEQKRFEELSQNAQEAARAQELKQKESKSNKSPSISQNESVIPQNFGLSSHSRNILAAEGLNREQPNNISQQKQKQSNSVTIVPSIGNQTDMVNKAKQNSVGILQKEFVSPVKAVTTTDARIKQNPFTKTPQHSIRLENIISSNQGSKDIFTKFQPSEQVNSTNIFTSPGNFKNLFTGQVPQVSGIEEEKNQENRQPLQFNQPTFAQYVPTPSFMQQYPSNLSNQSLFAQPSATPPSISFQNMQSSTPSFMSAPSGQAMFGSMMPPGGSAPPQFSTVDNPLKYFENPFLTASPSKVPPLSLFATTPTSNNNARNPTKEDRNKKKPVRIS